MARCTGRIADVEPRSRGFGLHVVRQAFGLAGRGSRTIRGGPPAKCTLVTRAPWTGSPDISRTRTRMSASRRSGAMTRTRSARRDTYAASSYAPPRSATYGERRARLSVDHHVVQRNPLGPLGPGLRRPLPRERHDRVRAGVAPYVRRGAVDGLQPLHLPDGSPTFPRRRRPKERRTRRRPGRPAGVPCDRNGREHERREQRAHDLSPETDDVRRGSCAVVG